MVLIPGWRYQTTFTAFRKCLTYLMLTQDKRISPKAWYRAHGLLQGHYFIWQPAPLHETAGSTMFVTIPICHVNTRAMFFSSEYYVSRTKRRQCVRIPSAHRQRSHLQNTWFIACQNSVELRQSMGREQRQFSYKITYPYSWTVQFDSKLPVTEIYLDL